MDINFWVITGCLITIVIKSNASSPSNIILLHSLTGIKNLLMTETIADKLLLLGFPSSGVEMK